MLIFCFRIILITVILLLCCNHSRSNSNTSPARSGEYNEYNASEINQQRLLLVSSAHIAGYTGTLLVLNHMWYRDFPRSSFHFHDDLTDWKQMDKGGHITAGYHLSRLSYKSFRWAGLDNNKAAMWGTISGNLFLSTIEILDGFSEQWGASWSDLAANAIGSLSFYAQQVAWQEQRISWKYSYSQTGVEKYRPDLLGANLAENLIKDYNGLTFWLSFNINSFPPENSIIPEWLNIAVGYSGMGMLGSTSNPEYHNGVLLPAYNRYRQFYLAPDIDLSRIPIRSNSLHQVLSVLNFLKFPAPALEYNAERGFVFHWVFF